METQRFGGILLGTRLESKMTNVWYMVMGIVMGWQLARMKLWEAIAIVVSSIAMIAGMVGFDKLKLVTDTSDYFGWAMAGVAAGTFLATFLICCWLAMKIGWVRPAPMAFAKQWRF